MKTTGGRFGPSGPASDSRFHLWSLCRISTDRTTTRRRRLQKRKLRDRGSQSAGEEEEAERGTGRAPRDRQHGFSIKKQKKSICQMFSVHSASPSITLISSQPVGKHGLSWWVCSRHTLGLLLLKTALQHNLKYAAQVSSVLHVFLVYGPESPVNRVRTVGTKCLDPSGHHGNGAEREEAKGGVEREAGLQY